ncbi:hypothetical protein SBOR_2617 [Sclerotinia borealis F-4128]|uniref:Uncharacterized protein n=1 Tax=Sclerotinia borealis (strain F-4128) TaxID=1432307 RepID=W9CMD7_SCLBF|nr:hypothetical protein SBOR_2617 [Sclerotinia borealis F-4128]
MSTMPKIFRPQNKKLQHPKMHPQPVPGCERERRVPSQGSGCIFPLAQLPSPSLVAARAYASRYQKPIGWKGDAGSRRGSLTEVQQIPRRYSTMGNLAENTAFLGNASFACSVEVIPEIRLTSEHLEESETRLIDAGSKGASVIGTSDARRHSETLIPSNPTHRVPFQYTHDRLQTWGHAYFGNIVTADAFVNAVSLRRPSLVIIKEQDVHESFRSSDQVTIRARVLPKAVERKPFLIQRQFDIRKLRDSIPAPRPSQEHPRGLATIRRSSRLRRLSLQQIPTQNQRGTVHPHLRRQINTDDVAVPIHIEYALHYLPVLAALMLSGHIRKGDSIDLPLPSPEAWVDTIAYVYTGQGEITLAMKENILFLAGRVESEG